MRLKVPAPPVKILVLGVLLLFSLAVLDTARNNSATVDEVGHLAAGLAYWQEQDFFVYHHSPPLGRLLMSLPTLLAGPETDFSRARDDYQVRVEHLVGRDLMQANRESYHSYLLSARAVTWAFAVLAGLLLYHWATRIYGAPAGLLALLLWTTEPMVIGHGGLATTDVPSAFMGLLTAFALWYYKEAPSLARFAGFSASLGMALLMKHSHLVLVPVFLAIWLIIRRKQPVSGTKKELVLLVLLPLLILNLGYGFQKTFKPLQDYHFQSSTLTGAPFDPEKKGNRFTHGALGHVPVPVPSEYLLGLDAQSADFQRDWQKYLDGEISTRGWNSYYFWGFLYKIPPGTMLLAGLSLLCFFGRSCRARTSDELLVCLPMLCFVLSLSLNPGLNQMRYALPVFPFACLFMSRVAGLGKHRWFKVLCSLALLMNLSSLVWIHPQELAYFNVMSGGPSRGHLRLADSNLDWGQDLFRLAEWMEDNPQARPMGLAYYSIVEPSLYGIDYFAAPRGPSEHLGREEIAGPLPGWYAVSANFVVGLHFYSPDGKGGLQQPTPGGYDYFRHFTPVDRAGYGFFIYHLTPPEVSRVRALLHMKPLSEVEEAFGEGGGRMR